MAKPINIANTLFILISTAAAMIGLLAWWVFPYMSPKTLLLALVYLLLCGVSITCGYHRLFSHKSYQASPIIKCIFLFFGAASFQGSVLQWTHDHYLHHRHTDTPLDPYNAKRGFWYSHVGWLFTVQDDERDYRRVADLQADSLVMFQHKYYRSLAIFSGLILPMLISLLWSDAFGGLFIAGALRIALVSHGTFSINSLCHIIGSQPYEQRNTARDNPLLAFITFGEGYHNFHHKFPHDYRNGIHWYDYDPSKWLIFLLSKMGLAWQLKRIPATRIAAAKLGE